ncbi:MAG: amino acid adenylation domain-containing protein [Rhodobacter sp.]|nr:amino acid adenylation domain-containing protein [Rhodobacter sp.]
MIDLAVVESEAGTGAETLLDRLEASFAENRNRTALVWGDESYTYADLYDACDRLKHVLINHGCQPGARVALLVAHSPNLVASILAVIKAGATYVPLDARAPLERLKFMIDDCGAELAVVDDANFKHMESLNVCPVHVDEARQSKRYHPDRGSRADDLVYILYTSGSTGRPKGVGITQSNLLTYSDWALSAYFPEKDDRIALYSTLTFDFTVTSIIPPLLAGASISVFDGITNPLVIRDITTDKSTNVLKITPAYLHLLSELPTDLAHLRRVIVGGEDLSVELAAKIQPRLGAGADIINEYGPTEATVGCVVHQFKPLQDTRGSVPIGRPIPGVRAFVVDEGGTELHGACSGELVVAGRNVAPGYINLPDRTSEVFTGNSDGEGGRSYRTGDLVRRRGDGTLEFLGRTDDQVKIRGNRVELGEVTAAILRLRSVRSAFVFAIPEHSTNSLAAAIVVDDEGPDAKDIQNALAGRLPAYMVPTSVKIVGELPLSPNQKIDRDKVLSLFRKEGSPK